MIRLDLELIYTQHLLKNKWLGRKCYDLFDISAFVCYDVSS